MEQKHDELLVRISVHSEEMKFNKNQQWRTLYYAILYITVIVIAFQQPVYLGSAYYCLAKVIGIIVVLFISILSCYHIALLNMELKLNRAASEILEDEINKITKLSKEIENKCKSQYKEICKDFEDNPRFPNKLNIHLVKRLSCKKLQERTYTCIYNFLFISIVLVSGIAGGFLIFFDQ